MHERPESVSHEFHELYGTESVLKWFWNDFEIPRNFTQIISAAVMLFPYQLLLLLLVAVLGMIRAASTNSSINDSIRRGQKHHTTEKLRADKERKQFRRLGFSSIPNGSQHGLSSQSKSLPSSSSSQSVLLSRFGRRDDGDDDYDNHNEIIQTINEQHVISHPRLPPRVTVKISSTRNESSLFLSCHWELLDFAMCRSSSSWFSCHDTTNLPRTEWQWRIRRIGRRGNGRRSKFWCASRGSIVLRVIASGSNSGSTATLEDMLRVEYDRDSDANLMVASTMSISV